MNLLNNVALFLLDTFFSLYTSVFILRWVLQVARADFYHPLSQFAVRITNPVLIPVRRVVPGLLGIDWASLLVIFGLTGLKVLGMSWLGGKFSFAQGGIITIAWTLQAFLNLYFYALILMVLVSWIAPGNPLYGLLLQILRPVLAPFQRWLPPIAGFDLSPVFAMITLQLLSIVGVGELSYLAFTLS